MAVRELVARSPLASLSLGGLSGGALNASIDKHLGLVYNTLTILGDWIEHRFKKITASYSVDNETAILADATGGAITVTLPLSNSETINRAILVKRLNAGANAVTVQRSGADLIDGAATNVLGAQYAVVRLLSDGAGTWHVI